MIFGHARQTGFKLLDDFVQRIEDTIGNLFFPQFIPDVFLRIEFGLIAGQPEKARISLASCDRCMVR